MFSPSYVLFLFAVLVFKCDSLLNKGRDADDKWVVALDECAEAAKNENIGLAVQCQNAMNEMSQSEEGLGGYDSCDQEYCLCTGGTWADGSCVIRDECEYSCACMEECYKAQLECAFDHTVSLYATAVSDSGANPCTEVKFTECMTETKPALIAECKRGLTASTPFLSWMSQPVPRGCDAVVVCEDFFFWIFLDFFLQQVCGESGARLAVSFSLLVASLMLVVV